MLRKYGVLFFALVFVICFNNGFSTGENNSSTKPVIALHTYVEILTLKLFNINKLPARNTNYESINECETFEINHCSTP